MSNEYEGYKDESIKYLKQAGVKVWSRIKITDNGITREGIILPRNKFARDGFVEIKLSSGYNIGIPLSDSVKIELIANEPPMKVAFETAKTTPKANLPNVILLGTGGTIASRLDYATGGVIPAFEPAELFTAVPELSEICNLNTRTVYQIFSEDMSPKHWATMAENVIKEINNYDGIVIGHGTDTMSFTAAALSFMLKDLNKPVIIVGSQRSSDRPSSDAAINLINAMTVAGNANLAEVGLCMLGTSNHIYGFIHRGTRVRKMHSSVRHTFRTIGDIPLGYVYNRKVEILKKDAKPRRSDLNPYCEPKIEDKVGLIYSYPGMNSEIIDHYIDKGYKGLVLAGTGLGHFPHSTFKSLERANEQGIAMVMVVQTLWGFTGMDVYETGRELQALGVIPGENMLPETAYAKLVWTLGQTQNKEEIKKIMTTNIAGEILQGEPPNGFQVMQGIEDSLKLLPRIGTKKITPTFEFLEHTADIWVHAKGNTLEEAFEQCVYAMMKVMTDPNKIESNKRKQISVKATDLNHLIVNFLTHFLVLFDSENFLVSKVVVNPIKKAGNEYVLDAYALGEDFDDKKHLKDTEIKAITYMQLEITEIDNHYEIKIVYDI